MNNLVGSQWLLKCKAQLDIFNIQLQKSKHGDFKRKVYKLMMNLEMIFERIEKDIDYVDIAVLKMFDSQFNKLLCFMLEPKNLERPSFAATFFITDSLQIRQDRFLNEFESLLETQDSFKIQDFTYSRIGKTINLIDASTLQLFVEFHFTVVKQEEVVSFASNFIFSQMGKVFIHQVSSDWLSRKLSDWSLPLRNVLLTLTIECEDHDTGARVLTAHLNDPNVTFINEDQILPGASFKFKTASLEDRELMLFNAEEAFAIQLHNLKITINPLTNWKTDRIY